MIVYTKLELPANTKWTVQSHQASQVRKLELTVKLILDNVIEYFQQEEYQMMVVW